VTIGRTHPWAFGGGAGPESLLPGDDEDARRPRRRHRAERRRRRRAARAEQGAEEAALSPEERAWREARALAERKVRVTGDLVKVGLVALVLFVLKLGWIAFLVLLVCGAKLFRELYRLSVEPRLRERFVDREVERQVHHTLSGERRSLEGQQAQRLERLSASIAHEIRNPITAAKSLVQQMGEDPTAKQNVDYARVAVEELQRVERSVSHLLRFARDEDLCRDELALSEVIDSALASVRDRVARSGIRLETRIDSPGRMRGDAEKLRRVVINLVGNAIEALEESGTESPRIDVEMGENLAGTEVWLRVRDNGPGIDAEAVERIWSPFFTSKRGGTGLGLALTRRLTDAHGGRIEVESAPGRGAEFVLQLPKRKNGGAETRGGLS